VATYRTVLPGYLETMRLPLVRGRDFTAADRPGSPDVVIVNQRLADVQFPGEEPLGKWIQVPAGVDAPWRTIVGVSKNAVQRTPGEESGEEVYLPVLQDAGFRQRTGRSNYLTYVIRTADSPATILPSVRAAIRRLAPTAPISDVVVMTDVVHGATRGAEFTLVVIGVFAALALVLAAIGIYSVISYGVELRRREIGIRLALGATPRGIAGRIVGEGLVVTGIGGGIGLGLAVISAQLMSRLLFGVTPFDVPALTGAAVALVTAATLACLVPARRASRIDPQAELR
jgi:putative ABC transport system permease protein